MIITLTNRKLVQMNTDWIKDLFSELLIMYKHRLKTEKNNEINNVKMSKKMMKSLIKISPMDSNENETPKEIAVRKNDNNDEASAKKMMNLSCANFEFFKVYRRVEFEEFESIDSISVNASFANNG